MRWRTAKMSWSQGSPLELVGEPQRCLFQRDFACSVLYASRLTPIVCEESSVTGSCLSLWTSQTPTLYIKLPRRLVTHAIPECGHLPHEEEPDEINRLLIDFLADGKS